jgi:hypothetical protein
MRARRLSAPVLACLLAACADRATAGRTWQGCLERSDPAPPVRACGEITVRGTVRDTAQFVAQVRHTIPLERLTAKAGLRQPRQGVADRAGDSWHLQLGTPQPRLTGEAVEAVDNGSFVLNLAVRGDSLLGSWGRTCFGGCPEFGSVALRRVHPPR